MVDPAFSKTLNKDFSGAMLLPDPTSVPLKNALQSQNVQFGPNKVGTRLGFSLAFATTDSVGAMFNWISSLGNLLLWYRTSDRSVRLLDVDVAISSSTVIAGDLIGYAATFAEAGARLFLSFFTAAGLGASGARVLTYQAPNFVSDLAFRPPITYVPPAPTQPGAGTVTAGLHNLGYRIESRSGFVGRLSPDSGVGPFPSDTSFTPVQFTASGSKYLSWTLTTTWPADAINVYAVMTPVSNPADYRLIPGAVQAVTGGSTSAITFVIDISDGLLSANGAESNDAALLMTNSVANVPQVLPSEVFTHGNRMVYLVEIPDAVGNMVSAFLISDVGKYQSINAERSLVQLPGLKKAVKGISLDGVLYMFGPQWTYQTIDSGGDPRSWPTPKLVDGRRGTLSVRGVEVAPSGTYAWVASQDGLYFFPGVFPALPISYYQQPVWDRIDWNTPNAVIVRDDPSVKKVYVKAALGAALEVEEVSDEAGTYLLTWDYTNGYEPEKVRFSFDFLQSYSIGAIEVVKNGLPGSVTAAAQSKELWLGSSNAEGILRRNTLEDAVPYFDNSFPVFATYETALYPPASNSGEVLQHHGADYRLTGSGTLQITAYELDHAQSFEEEIVDLDAAPGEVVFRGFDLISEGVSHLFTQGQNLIDDPDFSGVTFAPGPPSPPIPVPVTVRNSQETFTYAGVPFVLAQTPLADTTPQLFWGGIFQQNVPANYTISGTIVTPVNAAYAVGDEFSVEYFW